MPAQDTTARCPLLPSDAIGASSTSELQFTKSGVNCTCPFEGSNVNRNRPFFIRLWGRATGGTTTNLTIKLYYGLATGTNLATSGAIAVNSVSGNFFLEALVVVDNTSLKMQGLLKGWVNATAVAQAFLTTATTATDPSVEGNSFSVTAQFSASNAGNLAILDGFEVVEA